MFLEILFLFFKDMSLKTPKRCFRETSLKTPKLKKYLATIFFLIYDIDVKYNKIYKQRSEKYAWVKIKFREYRN